MEILGVLLAFVGFALGIYEIINTLRGKENKRVLCGVVIWWVFTSSRLPFLPYLRLAIRQAIANEDSPHSRVSSRYESRSLGLPFSSRMGRPVYSLC